MAIIAKHSLGKKNFHRVKIFSAENGLRYCLYNLPFKCVTLGTRDLKSNLAVGYHDLDCIN